MGWVWAGLTPYVLYVSFFVFTVCVGEGGFLFKFKGTFVESGGSNNMV